MQIVILKMVPVSFVLDYFQTLERSLVPSKIQNCVKWYFSKYINSDSKSKIRKFKIFYLGKIGNSKFFSDFLDSEVTIFDRFVGLGRIC